MISLRNSFVQISLILVAGFFLLNPGSALACSGACATDSDCSANSCRYCDSDFGVCADCCEFTDSISCPSACTWTGTECRNDSLVECGVPLPETPRSFKNYFFVGIAIALIAIALLGKFKPWRKRAKGSTTQV